MLNPVFFEIITIIVPAFAGALFFFALQETFVWHRRKKDKRTSEWIALSIETRYELARRQGIQPDASPDEVAETLCDEWLKLRRITLADKILIIRAGYSPENARSVLRTLGRETLQVQAALRGISYPTNSDYMHKMI